MSNDPTIALLEAAEKNEALQLMVTAYPEVMGLLKRAFKVGFAEGALWATKQDLQRLH